MNNIELQKREKLGKASKQLIREGFIPAVVYNAKKESFSIQIPTVVAEEIVSSATSTTLLDATLDGKKIKVVVKDVDKNPLTDRIRHIALFMIDATEEMSFTIPFNLVGVAPAVKNNLGILVKALDSIEVRCKSENLVPQIDIDISNLNHPGQSITVADIALPEGITLPNEEFAQAAIVTITQIQKVEEEKPAEEVAEATTEGETAEEGATEDEAQKTE